MIKRPFGISSPAKREYNFREGCGWILNFGNWYVLNSAQTHSGSSHISDLALLLG